MSESLDIPEGEGYWAFDGRIDGSSVDKLQWLVMVKRNSIDNNLYAYRFGGHTHRVSVMFGKWTRVYVPWESPNE